MNIHLTAAQLDTALIDAADLPPAAAAHLAACAACTARLQQAQAPLAAFGAVSLAWSERRSATLPAPPVDVRTAWARTLTLPASVGTVVTAAMAAVLILPSLHRPAASTTVAATPAAQTADQTAGIAVPSIAAPHHHVAAAISPDDAQISRDNTMLRAIDQELDASAATPAALDRDLGLQPATSLLD